ncbi:MAG TPA: CpsD/CapB family tyrosine-protein kinase [Anaerovoracaceae bacterium]|nr:CpsD/CapB family tyrosine-protein kinase [Anaerovoracaceae bacterium]
MLKTKKKPRGRKIRAHITEASDFAVTEAYKMIRTNLIFSLNKKGCRKIIVTSGLPKEGKSTTCVNLAITLAQTDSRVLLIDCDLRKPIIHKILKLKSIPGISDFLGGLCGLESCFRDTVYPNLEVICAGTAPPNPGELLGGEGMEACLAGLEKEFDYILMDTPPVNMISDALNLSKLCDGVVVVVKQGETLQPELSKTLSRLAFVEAKVLGLVLNGVERKGGYGYGKYGKKYKYGYEYSDASS